MFDIFVSKGTQHKGYTEKNVGRYLQGDEFDPESKEPIFITPGL
jgi:hypothetical protein